MNFGITPIEIIRGSLDRLQESGLQVLNLCNDGSGRSRVVAKTLVENHRIAAISLTGGLRHLFEDVSPDQRSCLVYMLSRIPYVSVILTREELRFYHEIASWPIRRYQYDRSATAVASLVKLIH